MAFLRSTLPLRTSIRAFVVPALTSLVLAACGGGGGGTPAPSGGGGGSSTPTPQTYTIGGSISGVSASGLVLQDNGSDKLTVPAGATSYTFATPVSAGGQYAVTIVSAPSNTNCAITNAGGTVAAANVTNVAVTCTPITYTIGGTVSGLTGSGLVLQDNGGDNFTVASGTSTFSFATPIAVGGAYSVTILTQPANQTCAVANGTGSVALAKVTNVAITCSNGYAIGGTVSGLTGSGLVLQDNGGDNLTVASGASTFSFATPIAVGGAYSVAVLTQPSNQTCAVANGKGNVVAAKGTNVTITCSNAPPTYTIAGTVIGLPSTNSTVVLQDNGGDNLTLQGGLTSFQFQFATALTSGAAYSITVLTQPASPAKTCRVTNGTGTVGTANISNVTINCLDVGRYVYVVNSTDNTNGDVSAFTIDATTGALTAVPGGAVAAHTSPSGIAIDADYSTPANTMVYVSNMTSADLTMFVYAGPSAGALTTVGNFALSPAAPVTLVPESIAVGPADRTASKYVFIGGSGTGSQGAITGLQLDSQGTVVAPANGFSPATAAEGPVLGLAIDGPAGLLFATTSSGNLLDVYSVQQDASLTAFAKGPYKTGNDPRGVAVWPLNTNNTYLTGFVYTANKGDNNISAFVFDASAGNLQPATTFATGRAPVGIAIDSTGTYLYSANSGDGTVSAFSIDPTTGALTSLGAAVASGNLNPTVNANPGPIDIKVDPSGQFVYCVNGTDGSVSLFTVKAGALTLSKTYATGTGAKAIAIY